MKKLPPKATRFKKSQSGNLSGRPKGLPKLDRAIAEVLTEGKLKKLLETLYRRATQRGCYRSAEILLERAYGKMKQSMDANIHAVGEIEHFMSLPEGEQEKYLEAIERKLLIEGNYEQDGEEEG